MNILAIFSSPCGLNGAAINLGLAVQALTQSGHTVHTLCRKRDEASTYLEQCGARTLFFNFPLGMNTTVLLESSRPRLSTTLLQNLKDIGRILAGFPLTLFLIRKLRPDLLFLMDITFPQCALAAFAMRLPVVCEVQAELIRGRFGLRRRWLAAILNRCDRMFGITPSHVAPFLEYGRSPATTLVIPNSVSTPASQPAGLPNVLRDTTTRDLILYTGGVTGYKGIDFVLPLIEQLSKQRPSVLLLLAGGFNKHYRSAYAQGTLSGAARETRLVFNFVKDHRLENHVRIIGERKDILTIMPHCRAVWAPHRLPHFSRPIIEAFAMKTPVVASLDTFNASLIENGVSGFLADFADTAAWMEASLKLLDDKSLAAQITEYAFAVYQSRFSPQTVEPKLVSCFESLIPAPSALHP